jgi:hypothetical protein
MYSLLYMLKCLLVCSFKDKLAINKTKRLLSDLTLIYNFTNRVILMSSLFVICVLFNDAVSSSV